MKSILKKSGFDEINFQARQFARILENAKVQNNSTHNGCKIIRLKVDDINSAVIDIVSKEEYIANSKKMYHLIFITTEKY